jgi:hypothetical protein
VQRHPKGGGGISLRLASGVQRGDLREDSLQAVRGVVGHRTLEGEGTTGDGKRVGPFVIRARHGVGD